MKLMKKAIGMTLSIAMTISAFAAFPVSGFAAEDDKTTKILFIGNSYTNRGIEQFNLPTIFKKLAEANGHTVTVESSCFDGSNLLQRTDSGNNEKIKKDAEEKIVQDDWDYIVLQEQSERPINDTKRAENRFYKSVELLNNKIAELKSNSEKKPQLAFYQTMAHRNGGKTNDDSVEYTFASGSEILKQEYEKMAAQYGGLPIPAGDAWLKLVNDGSTLADELWQTDNSHPTYLGSYMNACVFYAKIFNENPADLKPLDVISADRAAVVQKTAAEVCGFDIEEDENPDVDTYTYELKNAPETYNAVRLSYPSGTDTTPKTFAGTAVFLDKNEQIIYGTSQNIHFNITRNGAAVLDSSNIPSKHDAAKLKITVPKGTGKPELKAYLRYKKLDKADVISEISSKKGYESDSVEHLTNAWNSNHNDWSKIFDGTYDNNGNIINLGDRCGWNHNAVQVKKSEGILPDTANNNAVDSDGIYKLGITLPNNKAQEIAKIMVAVVPGQETAYQIKAINNTSTKLSDSTLYISADAVKSIESNELPKQNGNQKIKILSVPINSAARSLEIKLSDFQNKNSCAAEVYEMAFYGYEEIKMPSAVNTFKMNITEAVDTSIAKNVNATAVLSEIQLNDTTVTKITWKYGDKEISYGDGEKDTEISGEGLVTFGLILDWGANGIPDEFLKMEKDNVIDGNIIKTTIE